MNPDPPATDLQLYYLAVQFLYREAKLLDDRQFDPWLQLFHPQGYYWIPREVNQADPLETVSIIYEDAATLRLRINRLQHPRAHSLIPHPRSVHAVSNIIVYPPDDKAILKLESVQLVTVYRQTQQQLYTCRVYHRIDISASPWRIVSKQIDLIDCDGPQEALALIL